MTKFNKLSKAIKIRLIISLICALFPILLIILLELPYTSQLIHEYFDIEKEPVILRYVILLGLELFILWKILVYTRFFGSEKFQEKYFIEKNDERNDLILMKTYKYTIRTVIYALCGVALVASFFNIYLFYIIGGILLFTLITFIGTKLFFSKKY